MVKRDINAFRERFKRWKDGELVYDKGRPVDILSYETGKEDEESEFPILPVKHGDHVNTYQCATWSNSWLRDNGYMTYGNAWNLKGVDTLFSGFEDMKRPAKYDKRAIEEYNHAAADSLYKKFDSHTLDKSMPYVVNMFYNGSPSQEDAYNAKSDVTGTHTGILAYNPNKNRWYVTHNIHGTIYSEPFIPLLSGRGKYGVTAIYLPRKKTMLNMVKDMFGFKYGKDSGIHIKPSHRGRLTALKKRTGKSEAELYRTGGPAVRKMITFARNARKWKH